MLWCCWLFFFFVWLHIKLTIVYLTKIWNYHKLFQKKKKRWFRTFWPCLSIFYDLIFCGSWRWGCYEHHRPYQLLLLRIRSAFLFFASYTTICRTHIYWVLSIVLEFFLCVKWVFKKWKYIMLVNFFSQQNDFLFFLLRDNLWPDRLINSH